MRIVRFVKKNKLLNMAIAVGLLSMLTGSVLFASNYGALTMDDGTGATGLKPIEVRGDSNLDPATQNSSQSSGTTGSTGTSTKPYSYTPPQCTTTSIPFQTEYKEVSYLNKGETKVISEGKNGTLETCTADSSGYKPKDLRFDPWNKLVYVGTYVAPSSGGSTQPTRTYQQAANYCSAHGVPYDSSAWSQCINAYLNQ